MSGPSSSPFFGTSFQQLQSVQIYIYYDDAGSAISYTMRSIDTFMQNRFVTVIHSGVRIASAVTVGVTLALIARSYKSLMFCLYELNMSLMLISSALETAYMFSSPGSLTVDLTGGSPTQSGVNLGVAATVFQMLLAYSLLASLVVQVYVSHGDQRRLAQWAITVIAMMGCFPTILIWLWRCVLIGINGGHSDITAEAWDPDRLASAWVYKGAWPAFAASTSFCSLILCLKLWFVQRNRARLGLNHYDPIKIICVMATQNSVIPAVLAIISAALGTKNFGAASLSAASILITAILLPTGYIWAQFEILKDTHRPGRPSHFCNVDVEKSKYSAHSQADTDTSTSLNPSEEGLDPVDYRS